MLIASKIFLIIAGILLVIDSILRFPGIPNLVERLPWPCPGTLILLGVGILLFALGSKAFKSK